MTRAWFEEAFPINLKIPRSRTMTDNITIFDTTLRDGEQSPGASRTPRKLTASFKFATARGWNPETWFVFLWKDLTIMT